MEKLALFGGEPVRKQLLPYAKQEIGAADIKAVVQVLASDYITTGPAVDEFEKMFAKKVEAKYAVAVSSGTAALHAACFAAGLQPGDEVITTPITFAASANCILYLGAVPVFADIDSATYNINPTEIKKKITSKTKAIIPVHFTGQPVDMDLIHAIAHQEGVVVIEDAAHAAGARYKGRAIGGLSDMTIFSFHPVKHITTGEGGMITTNDGQLYEKLKMFRNHGITREIDKMSIISGEWYYEQHFLGYNYRMTDIQAALGLSQLSRLAEFITRRQEIVSAYNEAFKDLPPLNTPNVREDCFSSWHLYVITIDVELLGTDRRTVYDALKAENIGVNVHYLPVYHHPYYQRLGYPKGLCGMAEKYYQSCLTLPLFPAMTDLDVFDVIRGVNKVVGFFNKRC